MKIAIIGLGYVGLPLALEFGKNYLTVGYDFKFGKDRLGDVNLLKQLSSKYNYNILIVNPVADPLTSEIYSSSFSLL